MPPRFNLVIGLIIFIACVNSLQQADQCTGLDDAAEVVTQYWINRPVEVHGSFYDPTDDRLYLSYGDSPNGGIRRYTLNLETQAADVEFLYDNPEGESGRGITRLGDSFYQLTYQEGILNEFTLETNDDGNSLLRLQNQWAIPRDNDCVVPEGWGLTDDETFLYMSDGSNNIYRIDPATLSEFDADDFNIAYGPEECDDDSHFNLQYSVFQGDTGEGLERLNELELVNTNLYANIYDENFETFQVALIETQPDSDVMTVQRTYDFCLLRDLMCEELNRAGVSTTCQGPEDLNGIAYYNPSNSFILSGVNWQILFQVTLDDNMVIQ